MNRLQSLYNTEIVKKLQNELKVSNTLAVPRVQKVTLNVGLGKSITDSSLTEHVVKTLQRITGQKPVLTLAKKSISNFKIRKNMVVGAKVTLRGTRMYEFLDKLIHVALPRVRDFRGLSTNGVDANGNFSIGFTEHIVFPEIRSDEVEKLHGLEVNITTSAKTREQGIALFRALGFPFAETKSS